ncbi:LptA/OstA family protein [Holospora curviuscula]|uniref:OstA-like protein n=1 Tax=Holospora curviuscula TaxID=1082868 RepID=A0A2S5RE61_9PROT|nr:LptA/OstA family protein [Holospora curviuscula]PPE05594.1 OstA-like protein [Holospora curviuscula]
MRKLIKLNQSFILWIAIYPVVLCTPSHHIPAIEIQARENVQFFLEKKCCVARGDVCLKQGETQIVCQKIEIFFKDSVIHKVPEIHHIIATGNVVMRRGSSELKADDFIFYVDTQTFVAQSYSPTNVKFFQHDRQVSVQAQQIRYHLSTQKGIAKGCTRLTHAKGWLQSEEIFFVFSHTPSQSFNSVFPIDSLNKKGKLLAHAKGNVLVVYEDWKSSSKEAFYDQILDRIWLTGSVHAAKGTETFGITQNAILDLKKNCYRVKSSPACVSVLRIPVGQGISFKHRKRK